jgi:NAD(P)H-dependent flavin oxidoreductase YrpB (nitropropane dioxygenase family)
MTDKPFGVNLTFLPSVTPPDYPGLVDVIIDERRQDRGDRRQQSAEVAAAAARRRHRGDPQVHLGPSRAEGAEAIGCDAVSVDGFECGGHPGEDDVPNFILLPRAAEELAIPFLASGGMADGRSLVAALALGADGINLGTRFIATQRSPSAPQCEASAGGRLANWTPG